MKKFSTGLRVAAIATTGVIALGACSGGGGAGTSGAASGSAASGSTPRGGTLNLGQIQDVRSWDPAQAGVGPQLEPFQAVYDTLIMRKPDGSLAPMLATKWSYTDSSRSTFDLDLRSDVTFSDGTKLDAAAVKANLDHFRTGNGQQAGQLAGVSDVTVVDPDTVAIHLSQQNPALDYYLSQAAGLMASPKAISAGSLARSPVGSGPYAMDTASSVAGSQYVFTARDGYWNGALQHWSGVTFKVLSDPTARVNALVSGQVDAVGLDPRTVAQAKGSGKTVLTFNSDWMGLQLFDRGGKINPALADVRVRQAINYAFDRATILKQLQGGFGETTSQVFGTTSTGYVAGLDNAYPYDPGKAKQLLAQAGYANGFTLTIPLAAPMSAIAPFIVQPLKDVGITVQTTSVPVQNYQAELGSGKYAAGWWTMAQGPTWVAVQQLLTSQSLYNPFDSTDPELQKDIDAVKAGGPDASSSAQAMSRFLTQNAWFAPWFRVKQTYGYDNRKVAVQPQVEQAVP